MNLMFSSLLFWKIENDSYYLKMIFSKIVIAKVFLEIVFVF